MVGRRMFTVTGCDAYTEGQGWHREPNDRTCFWLRSHGFTFILRGTMFKATVVPSCTFQPEPVAVGMITVL